MYMCIYIYIHNCISFYIRMYIYIYIYTYPRESHVSPRGPTLWQIQYISILLYIIVYCTFSKVSKCSVVYSIVYSI